MCNVDGAELVADDLVQGQTVGGIEGALKQGAGHAEPDMAQIGGGGEAAVAELVDIEGPFGADVGMSASS